MTSFPGLRSFLLLAVYCLWAPVSAWSQEIVALAGSGSSDRAPLFAHWEEVFNRRHADIRVGYVATNSAEGIHEISEMHGDFASGEIPLSEQTAVPASGNLAEIPVALVTVVMVYNLPTNGQLRFTGKLLAEIFTGEVSRWNDSRIARLNPELLLPDLPIITIDRSDGSGTKHLFRNFLSLTNAEFAARRNQSRAETGLTIRHARDVAEKVLATQGAIGYVDLSLLSHYALKAALIHNHAGNFVSANQASIYAALSGISKDSQEFNRSLINGPGEESYPLVGFAWVYLSLTGENTERRQALHEFLAWCLGEGQADMAQGFVPLPENTASNARAKLDALLAKTH
jgi:phosphate transport system substrate-binding protein